MKESSCILQDSGTKQVRFDGSKLYVIARCKSWWWENKRMAVLRGLQGEATCLIAAAERLTTLLRLNPYMMFMFATLLDSCVCKILISRRWWRVERRLAVEVRPKSGLPSRGNAQRGNTVKVSMVY